MKCQCKGVVGLRLGRFQLERFLIGRQGARSVSLALPRYSQIVMAGRELGTLLDGLLKERQGIVELLLLQRIHALEDKIFRLRQARAKLAQCAYIIELLLCGTGLALGTQRDTKVIVRLFEIRLQLDRPPEGRALLNRVALAFGL